MPYILILVLTTTVNYLLLLSAGSMCGQVPKLSRLLLGAWVEGVYGLMCLLPGAAWLGAVQWRILSIPLIGVMAFGLEQIRCLIAFGILHLALDGVISDSGGKGIWLCGCMLLLMFLVHGKTAPLVPVELHYRGNSLRVNALRDTGNLLRDPITDSPVLVIGPEAARELTGLTPAQLRKPLETMGSIPGLRLIPYRAVGASGFLLALKLENVRIGTWRGSRLVAFAPDGLGNNGRYEALTGGTV